jgi:hypothetical protein
LGDCLGILIYDGFSSLNRDQRAFAIATMYEREKTGDHQYWLDALKEDGEAIYEDRDRLWTYLKIALGGVAGVPLLFAATIWIGRGFLS